MNKNNINNDVSKEERLKIWEKIRISAIEKEHRLNDTEDMIYGIAVTGLLINLFL